MSEDVIDVSLGGDTERLRCWARNTDGEVIAEGKPLLDPPRFEFGPFDEEVALADYQVTFKDGEKPVVLECRCFITLYPGETFTVPLGDA